MKHFIMSELYSESSLNLSERELSYCDAIRADG